ncbi:hypothetical protein FKM82_022713 [Ascaphus truei]
MTATWTGRGEKSWTEGASKGGKSKRGRNWKGSVTAERGEQEPHTSTPAIRARSVGERKATIREGSFQSRVSLSEPGLSYSK